MKNQKNKIRKISLVLVIALFGIFAFRAHAGLPDGCGLGNVLNSLTGQPCPVDNSGSGGSSGPSGYAFCSNENTFCQFSGFKDVAYGVAGKFYYKYNVNGGINCNNNIFGDPNYNQVKACYIKDSVSNNSDTGSYTGASSLTVSTDEATNVTYTTAILNGKGGDTSTKQTLPVTAYFRYSTAGISPIYCNDIYGTNMHSTKDISLGTTGVVSFHQTITGLTPDTTYYFCAIVSNKNNIAYGGSSIVKQFHTSPTQTSVTTRSATDIASDSATLNGSYSAIENIKTYFQYKKAGDTSGTWNEKGDQNYSIGNDANIYGDLSFNLSGLDKSTTYQFRAVGETSSGAETKTFYGNTLTFTTSYATEEGGTDGTGGTGTGGTGRGGNGGNGTGGTGGTSGGTGGTSTGVGTGVSGTSGKTGWGTSGRTSSGGGTVGGNSGSYQGGGSTYFTGGGGTNQGGNSGGNSGSNGTTSKTPLSLGQSATPPSDAIVHYHEGVETVFARQIINNQNLASSFGYTSGIDLQSFAWTTADQLGKMFGYVDSTGKEVRVSYPDVAAYQLEVSGSKVTVYEYYNNKIVDIRNATTTLKNKSDYEYYFKK